ncbi:MAG: hypothetical protein ACRC92_26660 [Peptostreptococcaceae bacterium]
MERNLERDLTVEKALLRAEREANGMVESIQRNYIEISSLYLGFADGFGPQYINIMVEGDDEPSIYKNPYAYVNEEDLVHAIKSLLEGDLITYIN